MSSLWTPGGEHRVPDDRPGSAPSPQEAPPAAGRRGPADRDDSSGRGAVGPGEEELAEEVAAFEQELLGVPAGEVVANHCYGLFQLAALHLGQQPPDLEEARIAIDALGALVESLGTRLGPGAPTLQEGLAQLRLAFVQISAVAGAAPQAGGHGPGERPLSR